MPPDDPTRVWAITLLGVLVLSGFVGQAGGVAGPADWTLASTAQGDPDTVLLTAELHADGSATWQVRYNFLLDDENATAAFESLQEDIRTNRSRFEAQFERRIQPSIWAAENATGREMAMRNVTVETNRQTIGQEYGVITYRFEWVGFARVDGSRIQAGDAIAGLFLDAETSLRVTWPDGYRSLAVEPEPHEARDAAVIWHGQYQFGSGEPRIVVTDEPPESPGTTPDGRQGDGLVGIPSGWLPTVVIVLIAAIAAAGWLSYRRTPGRGPDGQAGPQRTDSDDGGAEAPPEELLSNEERVLRLLEDRGGRMKQQDVAAEFEWTDAKTSQVVSSLREDGEIESFRLGRENVLTLPGYDLTGGGGDDDEPPDDR